MSHIKKILFLIFTTLFVIPLVSSAETYVYLTDVQKDWVWDKEGSPYILQDDIVIPPGHTLTVNPGVKILTNDTKRAKGISVFWTEGKLLFNGTEKEPIDFSLFGFFDIVNTEAVIRHTIFSSTTIISSKSTTTIEYSTIGDMPRGVSVSKSFVTIATSTLSNFGNMGMYVSGDKRRPLLYDVSDPNAEYIEDPVLSRISIHGSRIISPPNTRTIYNDSPNRINAQNNWWGSADGAKNISGVGLVLTEPYLTEDPDKKKECCPSVVFIPGFEGSRLYKDNFLTGTNTLWEPNRNEDVRKLYMDNSGVSIDSNIYTKDIIDTALGVKAVYSSFEDLMESLVSSGKIKAWLPLPYDWRKDVSDISDETTIQKIVDLATQSKTGKVVVLTHSNGGLVAKSLLQKLEARDKSDIIEKVVNIAVPELGTPEAILSMLHGHNQEIGLGWVMSENTARGLSQNLPGAYGLLPSRKFFEKNPFVVVSDLFSSNTLISSFDMMKDFLINSDFGEASSTDIAIPLHLNSQLSAKADLLHEIIDAWKPASSTKIISILGWGLPTSKGIEYIKDPHCSVDQECAPEFSASTTISGDGTVVTQANTGNAHSTFFFNLKKLVNDTGKEISHANILESAELLAKIRDVIINTVSDSPTYEKYFTTTEPVDDEVMLTIKIHSPVDINIYDPEGNHIGPPIKQDKEIYIPVEEKRIPGGYYRDFGKVKVVKVPYRTDYDIVLTGTDTGLFIVDATLSKQDAVIAQANWSELPVTPLTNIELELAATTDLFASSTVMNIDIDGDRAVDVYMHSKEFMHSTSSSIIVYVEIIRKTIQSLNLTDQIEKDWLKRIDNILINIEKNEYTKTEMTVKKIMTKKFKDRNIDDTQRMIILKTFENLLTIIEQKINN